MSEIRSTSPLTCAHCGNRAPMQIVAEYSRVTTHQDDNAKMSWEAGPYWQVIECPSCNNVLFVKGHWHEYLSDDVEPTYETLYPCGQEEISGLPTQIAKSYMAAQKVKTIDTNAFAVLLGRVLDLVCIDKSATGATLHEKLKDIANKGIMPQQLAEMAHALRQLRNIGAHADLGELTPTEVPILEALNKAILEYVYSAPNLVQQVQVKIDALKNTKP